ncbi:MAG: NAD(P)H-dependent oxidoreductase [Azoarcus sp.]|nr:NAD(P)H-dependent oxidoreductase [Azoarcus sp.]
MKVLVILGHPRSPSLCAALAAAYAAGARAAGMEVEELDLGRLDFDPDVHPVSPRDQPLEPDLERARELIAWADHLAFVYPAWWGVGPARLKGFLDRVLLPGFAFHERDDGRLEGLLGGRTAHLVTTLDMPPWVYRFIYRAPGHNAMRRSTLGFCGIETTRILALGPVRDSGPAHRAAWMERTRELGFSLGQGARSVADRCVGKLAAWAKALRLQFYPMTWGAYTVGALGAAALAGRWDPWLYWLGYALLFFAEAATVFINEWFDYDSDRRNTRFGPFNGGSRVLVDGDLGLRELQLGVVASAMVAFACIGLILDRLASLPLLAVLGAILVLGPGYTAPPLKLAWRGLGELDVALTHSLVVILLGYLLQGGGWADAFPWLVSVPLFVAVLPAIILSGIPDLEADRAAGKATLAVRLGSARALLLAAALVAVAPLLVLLLKNSPALRGSFDGLLAWVLPHAVLLGVMLYRHWRQGALAVRIDPLMVVALSYILWFVVVPLLHLW